MKHCFLLLLLFLKHCFKGRIISFQFSRSVMSDSLQPHARLLCLSTTPGVYSNDHVHPVVDAFQPSHPLSSPSLLPSVFPSIRVSSNESVLCIRWPKYWSFSFSNSPSNEYSGLIKDGLVGSPCSSRDFQESSPTPQFKSINSSVLCFLYSPTLTSIHDYGKNHSFD